MAFFTRGDLFMWPLLVCSMCDDDDYLRSLWPSVRKWFAGLIESEIERLVPGATIPTAPADRAEDRRRCADCKVALQLFAGATIEKSKRCRPAPGTKWSGSRKGLIVLEVIHRIAPLLG